MSILKRFDGTYNLDVYVAAADSPTGKPLRVKRMGVKDKAEANRLHAEILLALTTTGEWRGPRSNTHTSPVRLEPRNNATLKAALDLAWDDPEQGWKATTDGRKQFTNAATVIEIVGPMRQCASITRDDYMTAMQELKDRGNAPATVTRKMQAFHRVLYFAELKGWVKGRIRWQRAKGRRREFTFDAEVARQVIAYFKAEGNRDMRHLFGLGLATGMRASELQAVEGRWYAQQQQQLKIPAHLTKNGEPRTVALPRRARAIIRARIGLHGKGPLFPYMTEARRVNAMQRVRADLGYEGERDFVFHAARHTHGSEMADNEVNLQDIMGQMGHKTPLMSLHYIHAAAAARTKNIISKMGG